MVNSWFDSHNIVFIKYHGGAGGFALRQIMGLSPGTNIRLRPDVEIRDDGAAHVMLNRHDIFTDSSATDLMRLRDTVSEASGIQLQHLHTACLDNNVIDRIKQQHETCYAHDGTPMQQAVQDRKIVISDHLPISMVRSLFANAKVIRLMRDIRYSQRCFFLKNIMQSPRDDMGTFDGLQHHATSLDALLDMNKLEFTYQNYKMLIRYRMEEIYHEYDDRGVADHDVDGDSLFDPTQYQDQYLRLMEFCGLPINSELVCEFITRYHQLQYHRLSYKPNPDWGWVKSHF